MFPDALIIGAGVNGLLSALNLAQAGLRVEVVDQGGIAQESTWAGAGILSPLLPWDYGEDINVLTERGRALWPGLSRELLAQTGLDIEYWPCGMLATGIQDLAAALDWCGQHNWPCSPSEPRAEETSLWLPDVAQARNPRVAKALAEACRKAGVTIHTNTPILELNQRNGRVTAALTHAGLIHAGTYAVTAGAWSSKLLGPLGLGLQIAPVRGQILLFKAMPGLLEHILYRSGKYIVPRGDGHILVGSTLEEVGFEKHNTDTAKSELLDFALETLPSLCHAELVHQWSGLRPGSPGNLPTISRHPQLSNLFINSGHFRYGVTMGPASAEMLNELILGRTTTLPTHPYRWPI